MTVVKMFQVLIPIELLGVTLSRGRMRMRHWDIDILNRNILVFKNIIGVWLDWLLNRIELRQLRGLWLL